MLSKQARMIVGKTDSEDQNKWLPLWMHLKDTADMMQYLIQAYVPEGTREYLRNGQTEEELKKLCAFLGAAHDIGKDTAVFQEYVASKLSDQWRQRANENHYPLGRHTYDQKSQTRHQIATAVLLEEDGCPDAVMEIVAAHHGMPRERDKSNLAKYQLFALHSNYYDGNEAFYKDTQSELLVWVKQAAGIDSLGELMQPSQGASILLTGLLIMADWIASNTDYYPLIDVNEDPDESIYPERSFTAIKRLRLPDYWRPIVTGTPEELCRKRFSFSPNTLQNGICEVAGNMESPGILIVEAQMGTGKTEAALLAAEIMAEKAGRGGLFFGLPTQATANGLLPRIVGWANHQENQGLLSIRLVHGTAQFNEVFTSLPRDIAADDQTGLIVHEWFRGGKQALLSDYVVGTVDQVLLASLMRKHVMLRHLGLAGKVIVIDECHAYDAYMNVYLMRTLSWLGLYRVPVVILSATLPCGTRSKLVDAYLNRKGTEDRDAAWRTSEAYPLITWTDGKEVSQIEIPMGDDEKHIHVHKISDEQRAQILLKKLANGGCAGVICNTVARAQALYAELKSCFSEEELLLFHARYLTRDRSEKEQLLLQRLGKPVNNGGRPKRYIVVGTQVLEQSLDIDFDLMITDLCPMDLLLQRIGRLHRHKGRQRPEDVRQPECYVCGMEDDAMDISKLIYSEYLLRRTVMLLNDTICLPTDIAALVQATYRETDIPPELADAFEALQMERKESENRAKCYCLQAPSTKNDAKRTIRGLLDMEADVNEAAAEASVRDGEASIDVLLLVEYADGIGLVHWHGQGERYDPGHLDEKDAKQIGMERISLPQRFGGKRIEQTLSELEEMGERLSLWRKSPLLRGARFLLLNAELETQLSGCRLRYSREEGLTCEKEGGN